MSTEKLLEILEEEKFVVNSMMSRTEKLDRVRNWLQWVMNSADGDQLLDEILDGSQGQFEDNSLRIYDTMSDNMCGCMCANKLQEIHDITL